MKNEFVYANGMSIANARKVLKYIFADFLIKADKNDEKLRFDIYVSKTVLNEKGKTERLEDFVDIEYFNEYWNKSINQPVWKLFLVDINQQ